jgi:DNA-binding NarL/FixJ family response regulator
MKIKTVVIDDQPVVLEGVKAILGREVEHQFEVSTFGFGEPNLSTLIQGISPDLLIVDLGRDENKHQGFLADIRQTHPRLKVLIYSDSFHAPRSVSLLKEVINGCLLKSEPVTQLLVAVKRVLNQGVFFSETLDSLPSPSRNLKTHYGLANGSSKETLTKRELQILQLISQAFSNKQIAKNLYISVQTVGVHRKNIMKKLGVSNTAGLVKAAYEHALV